MTTPKGTSLRGISAVASQYEAPAPVQTPATPPPPSAQTTAQEVTPEAQQKPAAKPKAQVKFYADADVYEAFKQMHRATLTETGYQSLSEHLAQLMKDEVKRRKP